MIEVTETLDYPYNYIFMLQVHDNNIVLYKGRLLKVITDIASRFTLCIN